VIQRLTREMQALPFGSPERREARKRLQEAMRKRREAAEDSLPEAERNMLRARSAIHNAGQCAREDLPPELALAVKLYFGHEVADELAACIAAGVVL